MGTIKGWLNSHISTYTIEVVQTLRCGPLDLWFKHFPLLGNEMFYVLMVPYLLWFGPNNGGTARRFTLMTWLVCFLNNFWKEIFKLPRPPKRLHVNAAESEVSKHTVVQPGFPSTHSAHALTLAWLVATEVLASGATTAAATTVWTIACLHVLNVCTSRLYLGVHFMLDIVGGLVIGTLTILAFQQYGNTLDAWTVATPFGQCGTIAVTLLLLFFAYPDTRVENTAWTEIVIFAGLHTGVVLGTGPHSVQVLNDFVLPEWMASDPNTLTVPPAPLGTSVTAFFAGLIVLGTVRTVVSAIVKIGVKAAGGGYAEVARQFAVSAFVSWWVATGPNIPALTVEALSELYSYTPEPGYV